MTSCSDFGDGALDMAVNGPVWVPSVVGQYFTTNACNQAGRGFEIVPSNPPTRGAQAKWTTVTPPSMEIVAAVTPKNSVLIDPVSSDGFNASFFFTGGSQTIYPTSNCCGGMDYGTGISRFLPVPSRYFGWSVTCQITQCGGPYTILSVHGITLTAIDSTAPTLTPIGPNNISAAPGWVRGAGWQASFSAADDSGVCDIGSTVNGNVVQGFFDWFRNGHSWTQCPTPETMPLTLDTTRYPNGPIVLTAWAQDAASPANQASASTTLHIDNAPVSVSLSGPADALSTAGTQYVTASATAGPSGVAGYSCGIDGAPAVWYPGSGTRIPLDGLGVHQISCSAFNNARDINGNPGSSGVSTFTMTIRQPTVAGIWFPTVKNPIRCTVRTVRVKIPGKWVTVHRHHRPVWVQRPARWVSHKVTRCHARVVMRRTVVWTRVKRNGHAHWVKRVGYLRIVLPPTVVNSRSVRVGFGRTTRIAGWLGTTGLAPLAGQTVALLSAPANGSGVLREIGTATTDATGAWTATIAPGPSRVVEAVYLGSSTTEPASSNQASITVPARITLSIRPRRTHWGAKIRITGKVLGGYVPSSGELVVLYIGWTGGQAEIGHLYTDSRGRFAALYQFLRGNGTVHYWIWAGSVKESDYPYAPATSGRIPIVVSQRR